MVKLNEINKNSKILSESHAPLHLEAQSYPERCAH